MTSLYERYRPQQWSDVVGQDEAVKLFANQGESLGGQAFWLVGGTGTGKTTIARLAAGELADPFCIVEIDAQDVDAEFLREAERMMHLYGFGVKAGRVWIVNEAHRLSPRSVDKLKTLLEALPNHCAWFFTTTNDESELRFDDCVAAKPLLDRTSMIQLARRGICKPFAARLQACLADAGLDGHHEPEWYERCVKEAGNSLRGAFDIAARKLRSAGGV